MPSPTRLWGGRFELTMHPAAKKLSYTLGSDWVLLPYDIAVNKTHVTALNQAGIISKDWHDALHKALDNLVATAGNNPDYTGDDEDIHSFIERRVTEAVGDAGKAMHTGKSRNDQVMTCLRLYLKDQIQAINQLINNLLTVLYTVADKHKSVIMPGFTHFQPAQPVSVAHHFLAYAFMLVRDKDRLTACYNRTDCCPLGSGALAGTNYALDRNFMATNLGFSTVSRNSMDAVADRDFMIEFVSSCSILMLHVSRLCEELVLWSSPLINFIQIGDQFTTGSSIMPQKKNPDMAELIRGKTSRVLGHTTSLQSLMKSLPLTYNRDLQEDKPPVYDTAETVQDSLACLAPMLDSITLNTDHIRKALSIGYLDATELADYLVSVAVPFREAHDITGKLVSYAQQQGKALAMLTLDELQGYCPKINQDVYTWLGPEQAVKRKSCQGGTSPHSIQDQLAYLKELIT